MIVVIRIGGSVVASPLNSILIGRYAELLKTLTQLGHKVVAVVGGGSLARDFIKVSRELGLDEASGDWAAIHVSRLFARLFVMYLDDMVCNTIPISVEEAIVCLKRGKIVVMGGLKPGMTTDTVAAMVSEAADADLLVKASDVNGIYTRDPKKFPDAEKLHRLRFEDLNQILRENQHKAGIHQILDPEAVKFLEKSRTKTVVVNGLRPENVLSAVKGKPTGTIIE